MRPCPDPNCGQMNRSSARFCARCGRPLEAMPSARPMLQLGQTMRGGAYRIIQPLGRGGMGALYLAADTQTFDRPCVIKELLDYFDPTNPQEARKARERFEEEARILAALNHPGIPKIYTYFSENGRNYIVMEYIEGETLEGGITHPDEGGTMVPGRPLPSEEVVRHAIQICRVLEYLAGLPRPVVHHDIKPANIIIDGNSGRAALVDFGTAKARYTLQPGGRVGLEKSSLYGTEGYAPPEQYQGRSEPRSDVYALAATVYHLLTDDDPRDHPFRFPKLATLPRELAAALGAALRPKVQRRSTARELREALEAWLTPEGVAHPFTFRDGTVARTTSELVSLCDRHWEEARRHLREGDFKRWFRERNRHDLVAKVEAASHDDDEDAALETFLRFLDPRLPDPTLAVDPPALVFRPLARERPQTKNLTLSNPGRGYCRVSVASSAPWLRVGGGQVGCLGGKKAKVAVTLHPDALPLSSGHDAILTFTSPSGKVVTVPVRVEVSLAQKILWRLWKILQCLGVGAWSGARRGWRFWIRMTDRTLITHRGDFVPAGLIPLGGLVTCLLWARFMSWTVWYKYIFVFLAGCLLTVPTLYLLLALAFTATGALVGALLGGLREAIRRR